MELFHFLVALYWNFKSQFTHVGDHRDRILQIRILKKLAASSSTWGEFYLTITKQPKHTPPPVRIKVIVPSNKLRSTKRNFLLFFRVEGGLPTNHLREQISCVRILLNNLRNSLVCSFKPEVYRGNATKVGIEEIGDDILIWFWLGIVVTNVIDNYESLQGQRSC